MFDKYSAGYKEMIDEADIAIEVDDIENDIFFNIQDFLYNQDNQSNQFSHSIYLTDKYRYDNRHIDIIYPGISYPGGHKSLITRSDTIRFLLSLYSDKHHLENIEKIVLRPRYIEVNGIELVSLYIRRKRLLVYYLHNHYLYPVNEVESEVYSKSILNNISCMSDCRLSNKDTRSNEKRITRIPPLWHILSLVSYSPDNKIDKFLFKKNNTIKDNTAVLEDISLYYGRQGF